MSAKVQKVEKLMILASIIIFVWIFIYYAVVNPFIPYDYDDWRYFGFFESDPIPRLSQWNVTRILPEYLLPLSGYLSAYIIYPLVGDYLASASIALALLMAFSLSMLFIASYRLFYALNENSVACTLVSSMMMLLCFAIFKHAPENNVHMFFANSYNLHFYYILPNILNSIIVLLLTREIVLHKRLSINLWTPLMAGVLFVGIYLCMFSMLFAAGILLAFAVAVFLIRFFSAFRFEQKLSQKMKLFFIDLVTNYNIAPLIIVGMGAAMFLELQSRRSNEDWETIYKGSLLSFEFLKRFFISVKGLIAQIGIINKYVFLIIIIISCTAIVCHIKRRKQQSQIMRLALKCLIPLAFLTFFYSMVAAKGGTDRTSLNYCIYGVFFFLVLFVSLASLYLFKEITYSRLLFPFVFMMLLMLVLNSTRGRYTSFQAEEKAKLTNQVISLIDEASESGCRAIVMYVPENYDLPHWAMSRLSHTLYYHKITPTRVTILDVKYSTDGSFYYEAK